MKSTVTRGFTLIELLVVIAIIGLLAAIVLAAVGGARNKGVDAAVKGQLNNARAQNELFASNNGNSYYVSAGTNVCTSPQSANGDASILISAATSTGALSVLGVNVAQTTGVQVACEAAATAWAISAPLKASVAATPLFWCVDSSGQAEQTTSYLTTTACP